MVNDEEPVVSVLCVAYNHERYISKALKGMVCQETTFPYEILVYDDASSDRTPQIILDYANRYPAVVRPFCQQVNLHSKGYSPIFDVLLPEARGRFVALCEGDDYWTDRGKLQHQVDYMMDNPDYSLCMHAADVVSEDGTYLCRSVPAGQDFDLSTEQLIRNSVYSQTASMFARKEMLEKCSRGDYPMKIGLSLQGKVHFINTVMSAYRKESEGSWSVRVIRDRALAERHYRGRQRYLHELDESTEGKYHDAVEDMIERYEFDYLMKTKTYSREQKSRFKRLYKNAKGRKRLVLWLQMTCPKTYWFLKRR